MERLAFRAWDKETEFFRDEENVFINQAGGIYREDECEWYDDRYEIELFTGLKDKNGKKIYEGDIVKHNGSNMNAKAIPVCIIKFLDGAFCLKTDKTPPLKTDNAITIRDLMFEAKKWGKELKLEIIGNIHENPELLVTP